MPSGAVTDPEETTSSDDATLDRAGGPATTTGGSAVAAGGITTSLSLANVVVGFAFQALIAGKLGLGPLADDFQAAWAVVTFGTVVQFTLVTSLLVPRLQIAGIHGEAIARTRLPLLLGALAAVLQVVAAFALTSGDLQILLLVSAPSQLFAGATGLPQARAYIGRRYFVAGIGPVSNGIALLAITLLGFAGLGPLLLGVAVSAGYAAQWMATAVGSRGAVRWAEGRPIGSRLFIGVVGFTLVSKLQPLLERVLSLAVAAGATAALGFGQKTAQGLLLFSAFGLAVTATAALARHVSGKRWMEAAQLLGKTTAATTLLTSVVVAVAVPLAFPAVVILFERGEFSAADSRYVTDVLLLQLPWVAANSIAGVFTAHIYTHGHYARLLLASCAGLVATIGATFLLAIWIPGLAVASASSIGAISSLSVILWISRRTAVWNEFRRAIRTHAGLLWKCATLVGISILIYAILVALGLSYEFWPSVIGGTLIVLLSSGVLLLSPSTRTQIRETLNGRL